MLIYRIQLYLLTIPGYSEKNALVSNLATIQLYPTATTIGYTRQLLTAVTATSAAAAAVNFVLALTVVAILLMQIEIEMQVEIEVEIGHKSLQLGRCN